MLIPFSHLFEKYELHPESILHIGANSGQEADEYDKLGIKKVVWVEALPDVFSKLVQHVKHRPGHLPLQACVSEEDGDWIKFNVANNQGQSSSILPFGTHSVEHPTVKFTHQIAMQTVRIDTLLMKHGIWIEKGSFLNIDLQGAELLALKGMGRFLDQFASAYLEVNVKPLYQGCALLPEMDSFLAGKGFKRVETKMTGSGWGDALFIRV
jgi:FkbM family methyltransferase